MIPSASRASISEMLGTGFPGKDEEMRPGGVDRIGNEVIAHDYKSYGTEHLEIRLGVEVAPEHRRPLIFAHFFRKVLRPKTE